MNTFGTDKDERVDVPIGLRRSGVEGGKGIFHKYFNQLIFETKQDHIWGTAAQVALGDATIYSDSAGLIYDKDATDITANLQDDDVILITYDATLAANLIIQPSTATRLKIGMAKGAELDLGDAGSGVPYKIEVGSNVKKGSEIFLRAGFDFSENSIALADRRIVNNRAYGVKIKYNEDWIFDPQHSGEFLDLNTIADNPYLIEHDGSQYDWLSDATNLTKTLFRDLNRKTGGLIFDGPDYVETRSRFTLPAIAAYLFQVGAGYGFRRQISADDPDIHARTDINGVSVADTATFTNGSSVVTFASITDIKNGMRINGASVRGVPDGTTGTTILKNVDTTALTATMIDALTGLDIHTTETITAGAQAVTMDNSGAAGGGQQADAMQRITGNFGGKFASSDVETGTFSVSSGGSDRYSQFAATGYSIDFDNNDSTSPNAAKTNDDETRVKSTGIITYQRA